jgi:hypothetical protein
MSARRKNQNNTFEVLRKRGGARAKKVCMGGNYRLMAKRKKFNFNKAEIYPSRNSQKDLEDALGKNGRLHTPILHTFSPPCQAETKGLSGILGLSPSAFSRLRTFFLLKAI